MFSELPWLSPKAIESLLLSHIAGGTAQFRITAMPVFDDLVIERAYFVLRHANPKVCVLVYFV